MLSVGGQLRAASGDDQAKLSSKATALTQQMAHKIPLNEGQYVKLRQLNIRMLAEVQALHASLSNDPAALQEQLIEAQARYEWDLATMLWPRQMVAYDQSKPKLMAFTR